MFSIWKLIKFKPYIFVLILVLIGSIVVYFLTEKTTFTDLFTKNYQYTSQKVDGSLEDAEKLNLAQVKLLQTEYNDFSEIKYPTEADSISSITISDDAQINFSSVKLDKVSVIKLGKDNRLLNTKNIFNSSDAAQKISNKITNFIKSSVTLKEFEIMPGLNNTSEYYLEFLELLKNKLIEMQVTLTITLYPRWSDYFDYVLYRKYDPVFAENFNWEKLFNIADQYKIHLFGLTTENSILPWHVSTINWAEQIIQYYISKGAPRSKLVGVINTKTYVWPLRLIESNHFKNYIVDQKQAEIIDSNKEEVKTATLESNEDTIMQSNSAVKVVPSQNYLDAQTRLLNEYNLKGFIFN